MNLFSSEEVKDPILLPLQDAEVIYYENFFTTENATNYFSRLYTEINWQHDDIRMFGKLIKQPRLTALYSTEGKSYSYSGITMKPHPFTDTLLEIKSDIENVCNVSFNAVLLNLYRDGNDSNGWHSDDEKELGKNPIIASVSFGTTRMFHFKNKKDKFLKCKLLLTNGSLLIMKGGTQENWKHQLPKSKKVTTPRINLTFRTIK